MFEPLSFEIAFSHFVQSFSSSGLDSFFFVLTQLGNPVLWLGFIALLFWSGEEKKSFFLAGSLIFSAAVVGVLKIATLRPRPLSPDFRVLADEPLASYAFPSGHAATASSVFGYYWEKFAHSAKAAGSSVVLLVMLSRIYLGAHYLLDVIVGAGFGFVIGRFMHIAEEKYSGAKLSRKVLVEEVGLAFAILAAIVISLLFRDYAIASSFAGFFAGFFAFKLLGMNSAKLHGKQLLFKLAGGVCGAVIIATLTLVFKGISAEGFFLFGLWITLIYPAIHEKVLNSSKPK